MAATVSTLSRLTARGPPITALSAPVIENLPPRTAPAPSPEASSIRKTKKKKSASVAPGNVGAVPLEYPKGVELKVYSWPPSRDPTKYTSTSLQGATTAHVKGPLGQLFVPIYPGLKLDRLVGPNAWEPMRAVEDVDSPSSSASSSSSSDERRQCALNLSSSLSSISLSEHKKLGGNWGLSRQLLRNAIQGVSEGHSAVLKMVGVGYRASIEEGGTPLLSKLGQAFQAASSSKQTLRFLNQSQAKGHERFVQEEAAPEPKRLSLRLGYSHPILLQIPQGIKVAVPSPTRIVLRSADKEALGQFAVKIRSWRPPEPYKGKGVFVNDEEIRLKTPKKK